MSNGINFKLPGFEQPLESPEYYITGVARAFERTAQELGVTVEALMLRLGENPKGGEPLYEISLADRTEGRVFNGDHELFFGEGDGEFDRLLEEDQLQDTRYSLGHVQNWLNRVNGIIPDEQDSNALLREPGRTA